MMEQSYRAIDVMYAAHAAFSSVGNARYAKGKTDSFLRRCGADIQKPKEQPLGKTRVKSIAFAMLDEGTEVIFWAELRRRADAASNS